MPVRPKTTEYKEHFKWLSSPKSATFHPSLQQAAPIAGLNSAKLGMQAEPALQRRAKPIPLTTTSTTKMFDEDIVAPVPPQPQVAPPVPDDFMLLGSQEKFAHNVVYRDVAASKAKQRLAYSAAAPPADRGATAKPTLAATVGAAAPAGPPAAAAAPAARPYDRPPKVVVDTGARRRTTKAYTSEPKEDEPSSQPEARTTHGRGGRAAPEAAPAGGGRAPTAAAASSGREHRAIDTAAADSGEKAPAGDRPSGRVARRQEQDAEIARRQASAAKDTKVKYYDDNDNNNNNNGIGSNKSKSVSNGNLAASAGADEQASSTYAFKYKAGVAQPRLAKKRKSEYQTKFEWKVAPAPVLAADEEIRASKAPAPAVQRKAVPPPKESEYNRQFKSWVPYYKPVPAEYPAQGAEAAKLRRASSETSLVQQQQQQRQQRSASPAKHGPAGKRYTDTLNPQKPFFPHGRLVRWHSEYMANFRSFDQYKYDSGAWIGAAPPHRLYSSYQKPAAEGAADGRRPVAAAAAPAPQPSSKSWLAEVIELRKRAEEYRKRALGTHFSREHVAQLLAEQSRLWDQESGSTASGGGSEQAAAVEASLDGSEASSSTDRWPRADAEPSGAGDRPAATGAKRRSASESRAAGRYKTVGVTASSENRNNNAADDEQNDKESSFSGHAAARQREGWQSRKSGEARLLQAAAAAPAPGMSKQLAALVGHAREGPPSDSTRSVISGSTRGSMSAESSSSSTLNGEGRVPTPELRSSPTLRRHHLDITTPSKGGALLVRPQRAHRSPQGTHEDGSRPSTAPPSRDMPPAAHEARQAPGSGHKHRSHATADAGLRQQATSPLYGKPTVDTHALLDEEASHDEILETRYVHSPQRRRSTMRPDDDDSVSISSVCSSASSSLASEVLERARARRDQFWGLDGRVNGLTRR